MTRTGRRRLSTAARFAGAGAVAAALVAVPLLLRPEMAQHDGLWIVAVLLGINAATLCLYAYDKLGARRGWTRVPERTLHLFCLIGGSPAAFLAQRALRHKTRKGRFQKVFRLLVAIQVMVVIWILWVAFR